MVKKHDGVNVSPLFDVGNLDHTRNLAATIRVLAGVDPRQVFGADVFFDRIKFTDWSPDTCGCTLRYMWHRDHHEDTRNHHPHEILKACPAHAHLQTPRDHYNEVIAENQHKNRSVMKTAKDIGVPPAEIAHSYDDDRLLHLHHPKLCPNPITVPREA